MLLIFYVIILLKLDAWSFHRSPVMYLQKAMFVNTYQKKNTTRKYFKVVGSQKLVDINCSFLENNSAHSTCVSPGRALSVSRVLLLPVNRNATS